jgi:hypothetical protein
MDIPKYNQTTYVGFLKIKKGGMKIIPGEKDDIIIKRRDNVLNHLDLVLSGGKKLKEKNIEKYFKALGGKYIRNDFCITGDAGNCRNGKNISLGGADKLLKLASQNNLPMKSVLATFKGAAPSLYDHLEYKITGGTSQDRERELAEIRARKQAQKLNKTCDPMSLDEGRQFGWVGLNMQDEIIGADCDDEYKGPKAYLNLITKQMLEVNERAPTLYERKHPEEGIIRSTSKAYLSDKPVVNQNYLNEARRYQPSTVYGSYQNGGNELDELDKFRIEINRSTSDIELSKLRDELDKIRIN